jgi:uncharacterized repeat protein (TIGR01451 family)
MDFLKPRGWFLAGGVIFLVAAALLTSSTSPASAGGGPTMDCVKTGDLFGFPGDIISVTITCDFSPPASNTNGVDNIDLDDFLDVGLTFVPNSLNCPDATNEVIEPLPKLQATCDWHPLAVGETQVQMFVDIQIEDVACDQTLTQRFIANYDIDSDKTVNAQDDQSLEVRVLCADDVILEIEKTPDDETISGGDTATFAIEVANSGNIDVIVRLVDQLPGAAGLDWNLVSGPPDCEPDANDFVDCSFELPTQGPIMFSAETDEGECGDELLNEATVTFVEPAENFDLAPQQIGPILEATDTGSIFVECLAGGDTLPPTGRPTPEPDIDQVPTPTVQQPGAGRGPSVTTGDSGLTEDGATSGWQIAVLAGILAASLFGSAVAYRRLR